MNTEILFLSTKLKETYRFEIARALHVTENVHSRCRSLFLQPHVVMILFSHHVVLGGTDRMVVEICDYSARSISLTFHPSLALALSLFLTHRGSVGQQKDISGAVTTKKREK